MDHAPSHISGISPLCTIASVVSWVTVKSAVVDSYLETAPITNGPFLVSTEALLMVPNIDKAKILGIFCFFY